MENITIHADQVTVHLHASTESAARHVVTAPLVVDVDTKPLADAVQAAITAEAGSRFAKVFADGTLGEDGDTRTDHVAVIDRQAGLMWSVESLGNPEDANEGVTQEHCTERCRELPLLGFDNWRLPTRAELVSLIDDTRHEPAIDTNFFPRVLPRWHWTSTPCAWSSASAWFVHFYDGFVYSLPRSYNGFALAVRRVGQ